jgi:acetyl esterase/lipase
MTAAARLLLRRRSWGADETALARRARRLFGATTLHRTLAGHGLRIDPLRGGPVRGEWLTPPDARPGAILYLHGGGYVSCSAATHRPITAALARLGRRRVLSVDYRLAPEHRFPAAIDDVAAAYEWLLASGVPASGVAVAGDSAGGGLTLALLLRARDAGWPLPRCAVTFSPWVDLAGTGASRLANDGRCAMFRPENILGFAAAYLGDADAMHPLASPLFGDLHGLPPMLIQVDESELLLDDARRLHERLLAAGGESRLEIETGLFHCWQMLDGIVPESRAALRRAADFVDAQLTGR